MTVWGLQGQTDKLKLDFGYGGSSNNGNVMSQTITVPTGEGNAGFTATQTYNYDALNRLKDAAETIGGSQSWKQTFTYDRDGKLVKFISVLTEQKIRLLSYFDTDRQMNNIQPLYMTR